MSATRYYPRLPRLRLSAAELRATALRARDGDPEAGIRVVAATLPYVIRQTRHYRYQGHTDQEDLVQEGLDGLVTAVRKYDGTRGASFLNFATFWIRSRVLYYHLTNQLVRPPMSRAAKHEFFTTSQERQHARLRDVFESATPSPEVTAVERDALVRLPGVLHEYLKILSLRDRELFEEFVLSDEPPSYAMYGRSLRMSGERIRQIVKKLSGDFLAFARGRFAGGGGRI